MITFGLIINIVIWFLFIFAVYKLKPRTKIILGSTILVFYAFCIFILTSTDIIWNKFLHFGSQHTLLINIFSRFPNHINQISFILDLYIVISIISFILAILIIISSKRNLDITLVNSSNNNETSSSNLVSTSYISKAKDSMPLLTGRDIAESFNKVLELLDLDLLDEEEIQKRKDSLIKSIICSDIPKDIEAFTLDINKYAKENAFSKDDLKNILNICKIKSSLKLSTDKDLILTLSSDEEIDSLLFEASKFELFSRGYSKDSIENIQGLKNVSTLDIFEKYTKAKFEYLLFKLSSRDIDASSLLRMKLKLNLSNEEVLNRYLDDKDTLLTNYDNKIQAEIYKKTRFKRYIKSHKKLSITIISICVVLIIALCSFLVISRIHPSNDSIVNYIKSVNHNASDIQVLDTDFYPATNTTYIAEVSYNEKEGNKTFRTSGYLTYNYKNFKWMPSNFSVGFNTQIPTEALSVNQMKALVSHKMIDGVNIDSNYITFSNIVDKLDHNLQEADFTVNDPNLPGIKSFTGTAQFNFYDGKWSFTDAINEKLTYNAPNVNGAQLAQIFKNAENSPVKQFELPGTEIQLIPSNVYVNTSEGTATAVFTQILKNNGNASKTIYSAQFNYLVSNPLNLVNFTKPDWYLTSSNILSVSAHAN